MKAFRVFSDTLEDMYGPISLEVTSAKDLALTVIPILSLYPGISMVRDCVKADAEEDKAEVVAGIFAGMMMMMGLGLFLFLIGALITLGKKLKQFCCCET